MLVGVGNDLYRFREVGELRRGRNTGETLEEAAAVATTRGNGSAFGRGRDHAGRCMYVYVCMYLPAYPAVRSGSAGGLYCREGGKRTNESPFRIVEKDSPGNFL